MLQKIPIEKILFIDTETVPQYEFWNDIPEKGRELWETKTKNIRGELSAEEYYYERAAILAEFGKIVCISCGIVTGKNIRIKSFFGHSETKILTDFNDLLQTEYFDGNVILCAHNGKEFDFPFLARRMTINQIVIPNALQLHGKKPWEINHLDTLELWKFGDYKHYTSLDLLAYVLEIETPKGDIKGSEVSRVYYKEKNIERIKNYCEKDVETLINIFRKYRFEGVLKREN